jgi:hypothetical protein
MAYGNSEIQKTLTLGHGKVLKGNQKAARHVKLPTLFMSSSTICKPVALCNVASCKFHQISR